MVLRTVSYCLSALALQLNNTTIITFLTNGECKIRKIFIYLFTICFIFFCKENIFIRLNKTTSKYPHLKLLVVTTNKLIHTPSCEVIL